MIHVYFEHTLVPVVFNAELLCLLISQLECESFFPNLVCTKYFCSILLIEFISNGDDTSIVYLMDLAGTASCWMSLHEDRAVRGARCKTELTAGSGIT